MILFTPLTQALLGTDFPWIFQFMGIDELTPLEKVVA